MEGDGGRWVGCYVRTVTFLSLVAHPPGSFYTHKLSTPPSRHRGRLMKTFRHLLWSHVYHPVDVDPRSYSRVHKSIHTLCVRRFLRHEVYVTRENPYFYKYLTMYL